MKRIKRVLQIAIGVLSLGSFVSAHADPIMLNLAVGTLQLGSTENAFLAAFGVSSNSGLETPQIYFSTPSNFTFPAPSPSYAISSNPTFTFDYSFSVPSAATLSQNAIYGAFVGSATSTVSLLQGTNVVATATQETQYSLGASYIFPTVMLQSGTQYDLVITTLGLPASYTFPGTGSGSQGFAQVVLDVSPAATPEPSSVILLATGLLSIAGFTWTRKKQMTAVRPV